MRKIITLGIMLLFLGMTISSSTGFNFEKQSTVTTIDGNTLYVGGNGTGNYSKIQDAVDNASDGDTVFVFKGIYYEHLKVGKDINLFGEDKEKTVIDASGIETAVEIGAYVNLSGFTIRNAEEGVSNYFQPPPNDVYKFFVYGNIIKNNVVGLALGGSLNNIIHDNIIEYNQLGINFFYADDYEVNNGFIPK